MQYSFYKKSIVRRTTKYAGPQNGGIQLYLLASPELAPEWAGFKTDHSLITLHLTNNTNPREPGFWKLNTSELLSDEEYIGLIKKTIKEVANEYKNNNEMDATLLWDTMKMKIRSS